MKKQYKTYLKKFVCMSILLLCLLSAILLWWVCLCFTVTTSNTISEAKNTEFALRLLATEYYGKDRPIYDPLTPDGLAEGVAAEAAALSGAEGEVVLGSWDAARHAPRSFIYIKEKTVVVYRYEEQTGSSWRLYYQLRKAAMPDWTVQTETPVAE